MEWDKEIFINNILTRLKGRPQTELNKVVGRDAVSRWKGGERPSIEAVIKVADFFQCSIDDLVGEQKKEYIDLDLLRKIQYILSCNTKWIGSHLKQNVDSLYLGAVEMEKFFEKLDRIEGKLLGGTENGAELGLPEKLTTRRKTNP